MGGVSVGVTSESTVDDVERSDDVDGGVSVDLPLCLTTVVAVVATGLRSADCVREVLKPLRLAPPPLLLLAKYPGNLLVLVRHTCKTHKTDSTDDVRKWSVAHLVACRV